MIGWVDNTGKAAPVCCGPCCQGRMHPARAGRPASGPKASKDHPGATTLAGEGFVWQRPSTARKERAVTVLLLHNANCKFVCAVDPQPRRNRDGRAKRLVAHGAIANTQQQRGGLLPMAKAGRAGVTSASWQSCCCDGKDRSLCPRQTTWMEKR
eukprot:359498-Chlamydomonas_euryale.AAC.5